MCMGFWVGVFLWGISPYTELFSFSNQPMTAFMCGCISAGTSYFLSMLVEDYGIRVVHKGGEKSWQNGWSNQFDDAAQVAYFMWGWEPPR